MTSRLHAPRRLALVATTLAVFVGMTACSSLTHPKAQTENATDTLIVYALNGTPVDAPTGLWLFGRQAVVVLSRNDYERLQRQLEPLTSFFARAGLEDIEIERVKGAVRDEGEV